MANIGWLSLDRVIRLGVGLFVGVWVARYLGPEQFGLLNYAMAMVGLFGIFSTLGLDQIVIREIVSRTEESAEVMGTAFLLKLVGGVFAIFIAVLVTTFTRPGNLLAIGLVAIISAGFLFQSFDTIDFWFQANIQSKYTVYARNGAFLLSAGIKVILILAKSSVIWFAVAGLLEIGIGSLGLVYCYRRRGLSISGWKMSVIRAKSLLQVAWPLMLAGIAVAVYMKIDQVMLAGLVNDKEVGIYAAAVRVSEVWYFIPTIITSSVYPVLVNLYEKSKEQYLNRLKQIMGMFFWGTLGLSILISLMSELIIEVLYGPAYARSAGVLTIHIYAGIITSMSIVFSQKFILDGTTRISFYGTLVGAVANILLNFWLLPLYGAYGAAVATVISYLIPMIFQTVFFDKQIGLIFIEAVVSPVMYMKWSRGSTSEG